MKTVSMHEAKTHLSRLVNEEFVITKNGEPVARVTPLRSNSGSRFGFLPANIAREVQIPDDFDTMGSERIAELFGTER